MKSLILLDGGEFAFLYKKEFYKFPFALLEVVACDKPYLKFRIKNRNYLLKGTMKALTEVLPPFFIQISRNIFINAYFIENIKKHKSLFDAHTINGNSYKISYRRYQYVLSTIRKELQIETTTSVSY